VFKFDRACGLFVCDISEPFGGMNSQQSWRAGDGFNDFFTLFFSIFTVRFFALFFKRKPFRIHRQNLNLFQKRFKGLIEIFDGKMPGRALTPGYSSESL
jgi:hypothetical protein